MFSDSTSRRDNIDGLKSQLRSLGADHVLTYDEFLDRDKRKEIKSWIGEGELKLALNCVGGKETTEMVKLLGLDGVLGAYRLVSSDLDVCSPAFRQSPMEAWLNRPSRFPLHSSSSRNSPRALSSPCLRARNNSDLFISFTVLAFGCQTGSRHTPKSVLA